MLRALKSAGWNNYSLFLDDTGLLVGYLETDDFAAAQAAMVDTDVNARWQESMAPFFEALDGARPDESMRALPLIFQLETQLAALPQDTVPETITQRGAGRPFAGTERQAPHGDSH
jgi:L-rhamnose mutarotase